MHTQQPGLTFAHGFIDVRAAGTATDLSHDELLQRARERALDPSVLDSFPPFFFRGQISSSRWDSYDTRMGQSTLRNYADDAENGVAFLRNHNNAEDPTGSTLSGHYVSGQGDGVSHVESDLFVVPSDSDARAYIAKIRAGVVKDLSVGFFGGSWICSLCHKDMQNWSSGDDTCAHLLGMPYKPTDQAGTVPEVARATIEGARLAEVSGVYDGSTPGSMITKARSLNAAGQLNARSRGLVEARYRVLLPQPARRFAGVGLPATPPADPLTAAELFQGVPWDRWPRTTTLDELPARARDLAHRGA